MRIQLGVLEIEEEVERVGREADLCREIKELKCMKEMSEGYRFKGKGSGDWF